MLSELMWNSTFWTLPERCKLPPNVSWRQCSKARRLSGWRPGSEVTAQQSEFAWTVVMKYADDAPSVWREARPTSETLPVVVDGKGNRLVLLVGPQWDGVTTVKVKAEGTNHADKPERSG